MILVNILKYEIFTKKDSQVLHQSADMINWCLNNETKFEVLELGMRMVEAGSEKRDSEKQV